MLCMPCWNSCIDACSWPAKKHGTLDIFQHVILDFYKRLSAGRLTIAM